MRLLLASRNQNKLRELRQALPDWEVDLIETPEEPVEDGERFSDNARIKAMYGRAHAAPEAWVAGEDSGIEVDALGGRPGVESARWASDGVARLLSELAGVESRRARYVCEIVVVAPGGDEITASGTLEGEIALEPRGNEGFGYDPVFVPLGQTATVAELGGGWKAAHSHRAQAARALAARLAERSCGLS
ncbi:MAG: rdgB [Thermoleophilia bacterium]|nr:rdgB [Thermoleophilia bacterium]